MIESMVIEISLAGSRLVISDHPPGRFIPDPQTLPGIWVPTGYQLPFEFLQISFVLVHSQTDTRLFQIFQSLSVNHRVGRHLSTGINIRRSIEYTYGETWPGIPAGVPEHICV